MSYKIHLKTDDSMNNLESSHNSLSESIVMGNQATSLKKTLKNPSPVEQLIIDHGQDDDIVSQLINYYTDQPQPLSTSEGPTEDGSTSTKQITTITSPDDTVEDPSTKVAPPTIPRLYPAAVHVALANTVPVCSILLDHGADVNGAKGGWTALHVAVEREDVPLIRFLLSRGARATWQEGDKGTPPLEFAANKHSRVSLEALVDAGVDINAKSNCEDSIAFNLLHTKDAELLRWAHGRGLNINTPKSDGFTPLHKAALNGLVDRVTLLLELGADVNAVDDEGKTPSQKTRDEYNDNRSRDKSGCAECIRLLVAAGAQDPGLLPGLDSNESDNYGRRFAELHAEADELMGELRELDAIPSVRKSDHTRQIVALELALKEQREDFDRRMGEADARIAKLEAMLRCPEGPEVAEMGLGISTLSEVGQIQPDEGFLQQLRDHASEIQTLLSTSTLSEL